MNIVAVFGSPDRRGNSSRLAERFLDTATVKGANVERFILNDLKFRGCQACYACKKASETCVMKDDLTPTLNAALGCDVLILASPIYMRDVTGQMKCFCDRTFSFVGPEFLIDYSKGSRVKPGKKMLFIQTQANPDEKLFADVPLRYKEPFGKMMGFEFQSLIVAGIGMQENVLESRPELVKKVDGMADEIFNK